MTTITNTFEEQSAAAKNAAIKAINSGENIVLFGKAATGKTHLSQELRSILEDNDYTILPPPHKCDDDYTNKFLQPSNKNKKSKKYISKWITTITELECITSSLKYSSFVLVNMNNHAHPDYEKKKAHDEALQDEWQWLY